MELLHATTLQIISNLMSLVNSVSQDAAKGRVSTAVNLTLIYQGQWATVLLILNVLVLLIKI